MTPEVLTGLAGAGWSLALEYIPYLSTWYETLDAKIKKSVMALVLLLTAIAAVLASCYTDYSFFACSQDGVWQAVQTVVQSLLAGIIANQSVHRLSKKSPQTLA